MTYFARSGSKAIILAVLLSAGCSDQRARFGWDSPDFRLKGTYYFQPKAAVNNFWSALDFEKAEADFEQLRRDGFNTVVLFVPWGIFQPTVDPPTYSDKAFADLDRLLTLAETVGLKAVLRVGTHDHIPRDAGGRKWFAATVMTDEKEWQAFSDLFREVAEQTKKRSNVLFLFWTFEDTGYAPDLWFHQYPENAAAFRQWLRQKPLWWWNLFWWEENENYEKIEPPNQNIPPLNTMKLRSFLQFSDELTARRLAGPCLAAKEVNPDLLVSFQPRPEINWGHDFSLQYQLPDCYSFVTTWFSPYQSYIFSDHSRQLDGKRTAGYVPLYLQRTEALSQGLPVFIDQFNFQHFGGHSEEGRLGGEEEEHEFVAGALPYVLKHSLGYSLWNYYDYYLNVVSNGFFGFGLEDWETPVQPGLVEFEESSEDRGNAVLIRPGGYIRQHIAGLYAGQEYTLTFKAESLEKEGGRFQVMLSFSNTDAGDFLPRSDSAVEVDAEMKVVERKIKIPEDKGEMTMTFQAEESAVQIEEIMLYPWIDTGGLYTVEREPRIKLRDLFRRLNTSLP